MSAKGSGPAMTVRLSVCGKQTDPDGNTQENPALYTAACAPSGDGWLFSYEADGVPARLFLSRRLAWTERSEEEAQDTPGNRMVFDPSVPAAKCLYETPFGTIPMEIRTRRIALLGKGAAAAPEGHAGNTFRLRARIFYTLQMDPGYELSCTVTIRADST